MAMKDWSTVPSENDVAGSINFAEGQLPSTVNNSARQLMADVRTQFDDLEWRDWGHVPTRTSNTTFTVPGDQTAIYKVDRRLRAADSSTLYGTVTSVAYTSLTTVTVSLDSGSLSASLTAVSVGFDPGNVSIPVKAVGGQPPAVAGFVGGHVMYIFGDKASHGTNFNITANIGAAWESVGPTGSGATNIWTALDSVPVTAKALILKLENNVTGSTTGNTYSSFIHGRKTGSTDVPELSTRLSRTTIVNNTGTAIQDANEVTCFVPIDSSRRFDFYLETLGAGVSTINYANLVGWIDSLD